MKLRTCGAIPSRAFSLSRMATFWSAGNEGSRKTSRKSPLSRHAVIEVSPARARAQCGEQQQVRADLPGLLGGGDVDGQGGHLNASSMSLAQRLTAALRTTLSGSAR